MAYIPPSGQVQVCWLSFFLACLWALLLTQYVGGLGVLLPVPHAHTLSLPRHVESLSLEQSLLLEFLKVCGWSSHPLTSGRAVSHSLVC